MRPGGKIQPILHRAQYIQPFTSQSANALLLRYLPSKRNLSPASIKVYLSALRQYHIASDVPEPDRAKMQKLKIVSNGITCVSALKTKETHTRLPITPDILRRIYRLRQPNCHVYETTLMWAASTLCFFGFFRMAELAIPNDKVYDCLIHLSPGDIATDSHTNPTMLQVHLKTSKTARDRKGTTVIVGRTRDQLCPVRTVLPIISYSYSMLHIISTPVNPCWCEQV